MRLLNPDSASWSDVIPLYLGLIILFIGGLVISKMYLFANGINKRYKENGDPRNLIGTHFLNLTNNGFKHSETNYGDDYYLFWLDKEYYNYSFDVELRYEKEFIALKIRMNMEAFKEEKRFECPYNANYIQNKILQEIKIFEESKIKEIRKWGSELNTPYFKKHK